MAEEETEEEVEAAIAVYGADCTVRCRWPPHLLVRLQPRTANDVSQQFVEAVLVIKASTQYPIQAPVLELNDIKGLDDIRVLRLLSELRDLADGLRSSSMLLVICERALDRITEMNEPDGNCCFCLELLVTENEVADSRSFMKLLSCFHCFHSECFARWWQWMLQEKNLDTSGLLVGSRPEEQDIITSCKKLLEETEAKCPNCRKPIDLQDMLSIWTILCADVGQEQGFVPDSEVISSEIERERNEKFTALFRAQQQCGGIIEPRKLDVIVPGMFVPVPSTHSDKESGQASSTLQASESSSSSLDRAGEPKDPISFSLGGQGSTESRDGHMQPKFRGRDINPGARRKPRRSNCSGTQRGLWVRRDQADGR